MINRLIESKHNQHVKYWRDLAQQNRLDAQNSLWIEGIHLCQEALNSDWPIQSWIITPQAAENAEVQKLLSQSSSRIERFTVNQNVFGHISLLNNPFGIAAVATAPSIRNHLQDIDPNADVLGLIGVQDPGNIGTLLRSAVACGIDQIITTTAGASLWHPKVLRAAMGAHFKLRLSCELTQTTLIDGLTNQKFSLPIQTYALVAHSGLSIYQQDLSQPALWLLGAEGQGLPDELQNCCQGLTIPHRGHMESLNVAVAGSIALFEQQRQREL